MVYIFFYNKLTKIELINKINIKYDIYDGIIAVKKYNKENYILEISDIKEENDIILPGKIVYFDMNIYDIIQKIKNIEEVNFKNNGSTYILTLINAFKLNNDLCQTYIIY
jgi:deoxycytidine triphosphate deaminase